VANNNLIASDTFVSGNLNAWTAINTLSKGQVVGGVVEPNALSTEAGQFYTGFTATGDQISEAIVTVTFEANTNFQLCVRMQAGAYSGYKASIGKGGGTTLGVVIFRMDAGVATAISNVDTGLTSFPANSLVQMVAAGSALSVYVNGIRWGWIGDDTYLTGSPGFIQFSSVNITHSQCISWRGYGITQQDGIWTKKGVIIPGTAADYANSGFGRWNVSQILYEGNAQLISPNADGNVFKMWFMSGGNNASNQGQSRYAEANLPQGPWTIRSSPIISNFGIQSLLKNGSTYYAWGQSGTTQGTGVVSAYTSSDGITWTLQNASFLSKGAGGSWDDTGLYIQGNPVIIGGVWYFLYAGGTGTLASLNSGIATSPDGTTTATKNGGNPLILNAVSGPVLKVGSTFYTWTASGPGTNNNRSASTNFDPPETIRIASADMINWSATHYRSLHCSQLYEGVNGINGNTTSCIMFDFGGVTYNYYVGAPSNGASPQTYQISLATANNTLANIVTQPEDGAVQTATDAFPGGNGDLSSSWVTPPGGVKLTIVSNKVRPTTTGAYNMMYYGVGTAPNDQYSEITLATLNSGVSYLVVGVRMQSGSFSGYVAQCSGATGALASQTVQILKMTNGATTAIDNCAAVPYHPAVGDVLRLAVTTVNNLPTLSLYQNGALIQQVVERLGTYTSGFPGMGFFSNGVAGTEISLFAGGSVSSGGSSSTAFDILYRDKLYVSRVVTGL